MYFRYLFSFAFCWLLSYTVIGQNDSIVSLHEVIISDYHLKDFSNTQRVVVLPDSIIRNNPVSLVSLLRLNSSIYFKENGLGMVTSPSFRGTTAQQTAVIWNGININSQLNGQTDFNTISTQGFDAISIRSGGGSVLYGSSAIGGSIHLTNEMSFNNSFSTTFQSAYGSYNTYATYYEMKAATKVISSSISFTRNGSDNDYEYIGKNKKNENGNYYNNSLNANIAFRLNSNNQLKLYSQLWDSERHFSGTIASPAKSKYDDFNTRNLLEWTSFFNGFTTSFKTAYLTEKYKYFENKHSDIFESSQVKTFISKYDIAYQFSPNIKLNLIADYTQNKGEGGSIQSETRNIYSISGLLKHRISEKLIYEASLRKESSDIFKSPLLFSLGTGYYFTKNYNVKLNISKNYRIPSFNDLFWQGSGNPNLKPESALQFDFGNEITFKNTKFHLSGYYSKITDMLRWLPGSSGVWRPENTDSVTIYGLETGLEWHKKTGNNHFIISGNYSYTLSENDQTGKQLIYVPFHKISASLAYSYKNWSVFYQYLFNGEVFTSSDNAYTLKEFSVSNLGINYNFHKIFPARLGFHIQNLTNNYYENVAARPMPGINYMINLTLNL